MGGFTVQTITQQHGLAVTVSVDKNVNAAENSATSTKTRTRVLNSFT